MTEDSDDSGYSPTLSEVPHQMVTNSQLYEIQSGRRYSGDGTWTEANIICALVGGNSKEIALSKAAAAFANRDGRPEPLFKHTKADTYDLVCELESLPLAISDTPWEDKQPVAQLTTDAADNAIEQIRADSEFSTGDSIVFDEWGDKISSKADLEDELATLGEDGWVVVGIGLKPTGAGEGNDEYIGNSYSVFCKECQKETTCKCVNIVYNDQRDSHDGIWTCNECETDFRGVHPQGPDGMQSRGGRSEIR